VMIKKRVLVVVVDPLEAWTISSRLLKNGLEVIASTSSRDGFHQLEQGGFDYLVLDNQIEDVGLYTFLSYCHRYFPGTRVIVIAGPGPSISREMPFTAAEQCLARPLNAEALCDLVSRLAAREKTAITS